MEISILNPEFRRIDLIDDFKSLIWTERWRSWGDFELDISSNAWNRSRFLPGTHLSMNRSRRVMRVESTEDDMRGGEEILKIKGRSLELVLDERIAKETFQGDAPWYITGSPIGVARQLFNHVCIQGNVNALDVLPNVTHRYGVAGFPSEDMIDWVQEKPETLYDAIRKLAIEFDLGFAFLREEATEGPQGLIFEVYTGRDKTTRQDIWEPIVFNLDFENLHDVTEFHSIQNFRTTAYVFAEGRSSRNVSTNSSYSTVSGWERRIALVQPSVPDELTTAEAGTFMSNEGRTHIRNNHRNESILDGEVNQWDAFEYDWDYRLGDVVELRNRDGVRSYKTVSEQIFVDDEQGERAYPTLSTGRFAPPNTWDSYANKADTWDDFGTTVWDNL